MRRLYEIQLLIPNSLNDFADMINHALDESNAKYIIDDEWDKKEIVLTLNELELYCPQQDNNNNKSMLILRKKESSGT